MEKLGKKDGCTIYVYTTANCPTADEQSPRNSHFCNFQPLMDGLDEEGCVEEYCHVSEKKRRLNTDQVKALEKTFEVENKLEPERKVKLAQELGLQPRQVAVWFQNRRARWKTKQLERDYGVLKSNYETLKANYETLLRDNEKLHKEVMELKVKLQEENSESNLSVKEEVNHPLMEEPNDPLTELSRPESNINEECFKNSNNGSDDGGMEASLFPDNFKDGSSDSDSSAILNEDNSPNAAINSPEILHSHHLLVSPPSSSFKFNVLPSSSAPSASALNSFGQFQKSYNPPQHQFVKMEEHNFFSSEETCNFFSDEQAPTLPWYCSDQWS